MRFCAELFAGVGDLEHLQEAPRGFVAAAEPPHAPGALEQREAVELRLLVLQDLLVFDERAGVVVLAVEERLGARHVGVGHEAAVREPLEDAVAADERFVLLALLGRQKAVDVEREVVLLEALVVLEHAGKENARPLEVRLGHGAASDRRASSPTPESAATNCSRSVSQLSSPRRISASGISRALADSSLTKVSKSPTASWRSCFCPAMSRSIRRAICASSALRRCSGMRGPSFLAARSLLPACRPAGRAARPTAPPTTVRSAAGFTLDFSDAIAGESAAGGGAGGGFLSAHHAARPTPPRSSAATQDETRSRERPLRIAAQLIPSPPTYSSGQSSPSNGQYSSLSFR